MNKKPVIVMLGRPGAGKGTQSELLERILGVGHFSTGAALREEVASGSELGKKIGGRIERGLFVSDGLITSLVAEYLSNNSNKPGWLLDGFPRTMFQLQKLRVMVKKRNLELLGVVLDAPVGDLEQRLILRGQKQGRADDNWNTIGTRTEEYMRLTKPVVDQFLTSQVKHLIVDGQQSISQVNKDILDFLNKEIDQPQLGVN